MVLLVRSNMATSVEGKTTVLLNCGGKQYVVSVCNDVANRLLSDQSYASTYIDSLINRATAESVPQSEGLSQSIDADERVEEQNNEATQNHEIVTNSTDDFRWTPETTLLLISQRGFISEKFLNPLVKRKKLWDLIADRIKTVAGISVTGLACDAKWRNLAKRYRLVKDKLKHTGHNSITWEYYEKMDAILGINSSTSPPADRLIGSMVLTTNEDAQPSSLETLVANNHVLSSDSTSSAQENNAAIPPPPPPSLASRKRRNPEPPVWFIEHAKRREIERKEAREEEKRKWEEFKSIENEKIIAFRQMTNMLSELLKK